MSTPGTEGTTVSSPTASLGQEIRRLVNLAWPVSLAHLGAMMLGVVDVVMVGQLGEGPLAQVSLGHTYAFALQLPLLGFAVGLDPLFAQAFGARRAGSARSTLLRAMVLCAVACLPAMALHWMSAPILGLLGQAPDVVSGATPYTQVRALSVPTFAAFVVLRQYLQGAGRMWPGTVAVIVGNIVNAVVNAILVFGLLGAPRLGVVGAAWATVLSTAAMVATLAVLAAWTAPRVTGESDSGPSVSALLLVAGPVALQVGLEGWGFSVATVLVGMFGETALAAHAVAMTLASLAFMVPLGISSAAATRVGNLIGAGHRWARAGWVSVALGASAMLVFALAFATLPRWLARPFVDSVSAVELAATLLPVAAGFALFDGTQVVTFGVLRGAGDTTVPAAANVVGYYVIGMPLGAALAFGMGMGAIGVWIGLAVALACVAGLLLARLIWTVRRGGFRVA